MELPIVSKFSDEFVLAANSQQYEKINIWDIDGVYLVSIVRISGIDQAYIKTEFLAFTSLFEAQDYLHYDLGIEMPGYEDDYEEDYDDWRDEYYE